MLLQCGQRLFARFSSYSVANRGLTRCYTAEAKLSESTTELAPKIRPTPRAVVETYMQRKQLSNLEHLYGITKKDLLKVSDPGASWRFYDGDMYTMLQKAYPDHMWQGWKFPKAPDGFWSRQKNVADYLIWLCHQLYPDESASTSWRRLTSKDLKLNRGGGLLEHYNGSLAEVFRVAFPSEAISSWKYERVGLEYWRDNPNEQKAFFEYAQAKFGFSGLEGWYDVTSDRFLKLDYAFPLDRLYGGCVATAVAALFPSHSWQLWKFRKAPRGFWDEPKNLIAFFDALRAEKGFKTFEDLYNLSRDDVVAFGGSTLMFVFKGNMQLALEAAYPDHKFDSHRFQRTSSMKRER